MRVLVTGSKGQLGTELVSLLGERGTPVMGVDRPGVDIAQPGSIGNAFALFKPTVVINCAAWTAVDDAETDEAAALVANGVGPRVVAEACREAGAWLVQISTDYVFAGDATTPYDEHAAPAPLTAYGRTKLAGELAVQEVLPDAHHIVRTAWLYGTHGGNFARTMLRLMAERETVAVVTDQVGQPTYARDLARQLIALVDAQAPAGIFHGTNAGIASWFEFAQAVFAGAGADPARVLPTDSNAFVRPAPRPAYSVLGHDAWAEVGLTPMRDWRAALAAAFDDGLSA
ncbi:MAG: dTDP-4-dehydrorhamnose reductase [Candidatus Nanopelagicales bacterium]|nr:dTDP-4-dehydrorhamnose reductase [Candidatus Nanopelagicales bacterium]